MVKISTKLLTHISLIVAVLIGGGFAIFFVSSFFPVPGVKYVLMAPYLSLIMSFVLEMYRGIKNLIIVNIVFALVMGIINIYMSFAILLTTLATLIFSVVIPRTLKHRTIIIASGYSSFVIVTALVVSKFFLDFPGIDLNLITILSICAFIVGIFGSIIGIDISRRVNKSFKKE